LCMVDMNADGTAETCAAYYIHNGAGSCEGVDSLDTDGSATVCRINDGVAVQSGTIADPSAGKAGTTCSATPEMLVQDHAPDVSAASCLHRPINAMQENRVAVEPFIYIVNQNLATYLSAGTKIRDLSVQSDTARTIWGTRDTCDWQIVDPRVTTPVAISAVK